MDTAREIISDLTTTHGMTDAAIAAKVDSSQPTIWRIRTGVTSSCSDVLYRALHSLREAMLKADDRKAA